jgi:hypothetical protein
MTLRFRIGRRGLAFLLILAGCASGRDRVPDEIIVGELGMEQAFGGWKVECPRFERWLMDGDPNRRRIALKDPRLLEDLCLDETAHRQQKSFDDLRFDPQVRDLAYQLLADRYGLPRISYRDDRNKRDQAIGRMLAILN